MPAMSARRNVRSVRSRSKPIVTSKCAVKVPNSDLRNRIDSVTFVLKQTIKMKALTFTVLVWITFAATGFSRIGEDEKQIEARYGKPGKDLGTHGDMHELGYISGGFMILVDFVNGISQREGFANPDTSPLSPQSVEEILRISAPEGTSWKEAPARGDDRSWTRSDNKVIAMFPALRKFLFVQDVTFVQPKQ